MAEEKLKIAIPARLKDIGNYLAAMEALGAAPSQVEADCKAEDFDGLLLPGGADVDPAQYHRENVACGKTDPELDAWQLAVLERFIAQGKPVFGICRGQQLLNVYFGGTLIQHVPHAERHARDEGSTVDKAHPGLAEEGSFLAKLYGRAFVHNSAHHQAAELLGHGLRVMERSDDEDRLVEAICHESLPVWGVQWHPERMCFAHRRADTVDGSLVLAFFLEQVRACRDR